ncbi:hypothetical protein [Pontixanthobacter sp.]|uniref:hypothetical protein n=1 Tax=Pontixanthobacter sp. TaxID=2792078 RepID=UPI003C7E4122
MIVDLKDYLVAAILLDITQKSQSGFARVFDVDDFRDEFERVYSVNVPLPLLSASVSKLVEMDGGRVVSDPFTRDYIYLDPRKCEALFMESEDKPETVVGRAFLIGSKFIEEALLQIMELTEANLLAEFYDFEEPDRFVEIDHQNDQKVEAINDTFDELQKLLETNNESAIALGNDLELAKQEITALRVRWSSTKVRASAFVNQAQQSLVWLAREAGKTVVSQTAKQLYDLIVDFFF